MSPLKQNEALVSSPESATTTTSLFSVPSSSYLTIPTTRPLGRFFSLPGPTAFGEDDLDLLLQSSPAASSDPALEISEPLSNDAPFARQFPLLSARRRSRSPARGIFVPVYSASSADTEQSTYSNPPARPYRIHSFQNMSSHSISPAEKDQMISALQSHQINTLAELRRIEKVFAHLGSSDVAAPMTAAWSYYVNSHSLLTELRGLTKNYPFSSECLEEAKRRVYTDPESNRSWNLCWLVLSKVGNDQLIPYYAHYQASLPAMWGGRSPTTEGVEQLKNAFVTEWTWAINQMLSHWHQPPTR